MIFILRYWKQLALAIALVALIAFSWKQGVNSERAKWQMREYAQQQAYNAELIETHAKYRAKENKSASEAVARDLLAKQQLKEVSHAKDTIIANLRAGTLRLRDTATVSTCSSGVSKVAANTSEPDLPSQCGLSQGFSEYLVRRFYEADSEVIALNQCIDQLRADRQ